MEQLVFDTYQAAYIANAVISLNMRLSGNLTQQFATAQERTDGKFVLPVPEVRYMEFVTGYTVETVELSVGE
jgi:hypothetical protein